MVYTRGGTVYWCIPEGVQFDGVYQRGYSLMVYTRGGTV